VKIGNLPPKTVSIFLLGSEHNLISSNEAEQDAGSDKILDRFGLSRSPKFLIKNEEEIDKIDAQGVDVFVVFPCCAGRFTRFIRIAESEVPMIIVGEGDMFPHALDTYEYVADHINVEKAFTVEEAKNRISVLQAVRWVKESRILVVDMEDLKPEALAWFKNPLGLGKLKTCHVSLDKLFETFRETKASEAKELAGRWAEECDVKEPSFEDIVLSARVYLALKSLMKEIDADAVYVPWCAQLNPGLGTKPCFALAKLADDDIPVGCYKGENLLPLLILKAISGKPVFVCEANGHNNGIIELRHCFAPTTLADCRPVLRRWREMEHTVTAYCSLPKGQVTLVNCGIGDRITVARAEVIDCKDLEGDNCRITIYARLEEEQTAHKLVSREFALVYGDYAAKASAVAERLTLKL
jgi:L-fucose isomerase-like protein